MDSNRTSLDTIPVSTNSTESLDTHNPSESTFSRIKNILFRSIWRKSEAYERFSITADDRKGFPSSSVQKINFLIEKFFSMLRIKASSNDSNSVKNLVETPPHLNQHQTDNASSNNVKKKSELSIETPEKISTTSTTEEAKNQFIQQINNYSVNSFLTNQAIETELTEYLDMEGINTLHKGCITSTAAREAFIDFLFKQKISQKETIDTPPISLNTLLGKEGVRLYKAALAEEHNSKEFRSAVFVASSSKRGNNIEQAQVIYIIGPSACGKSSALEAVIKKTFPGETDSKGMNKLTSIDGAVERKLSKTSQLLLNFANSQGYQGVVGLHMSEGDMQVKSIKKCVLEAVKENKSISMIIPETFSKYGSGGQIGLKGVEQSRLMGNGEIGQMVKLASATERGIVLIEIIGKDPKEFQKSVAVMGNKRAWAKMGTKAPELSPKTSLPWESKAYGSFGFQFGVKGSKAAAKALKTEAMKNSGISFQPYRITNDLIAFKKKSDNTWARVDNVNDAKINSDSAVLVSSSLAEAWEKGNFQSIEDLNEIHISSLNDFRKKKDLQGFVEYCKNNQLQELLLTVI